ncbi:MAG: hypothetical protein AB7S26_03670 [Sandaracinaceae bacterium]
MKRVAILLVLLVPLTSCDETTEPDAAAARDGGGRDDGGRRDDGGGGDAGGGGGDSGMLDGGGDSDAGPAAVGCAGSTALFCEDFEDLAVGADSSSDWNAQVGNGSLAVDDARAVSGSHSLHSHTEMNSYAFMRIPFMPPGNSFFGRMRLYVTEFPSAPDWAHFTLVELNGMSGDRTRPIGGQFVPSCCGGPGSFWGIGSDGGPTGDWTEWRTSAPTEAGRWVCVEWEMDATDNYIHVVFDGVENAELTADTDHHGGSSVPFVFPDFTTVKIGWQLYQGGPTPSQYDVWIDDVVFDTARVGCE